MSISRRRFLETAAATPAVAAHAQAPGQTVNKKTGMPMRPFGSTGARISALAFGSGSRWLAYKDLDKALAAINKALDLGVTYVDTAITYGNGQSEEWLGNIVPQIRKGIWLTTKISARNGDEAQKTFEASLKRLKTDHVDLVHIHSLTTAGDLAEIEKKGNVLDVVHKLRDQKMARFIGISCHTDPEILKTALERHDFDCTQMALNAARVGGVKRDGKMLSASFETIALPVATRKKMGVIAMKVFGQEALVGSAPIEKLIRYALTLPVAACVLGMPKMEFVEQNIAIVKAFKPLPPDEMKVLAENLSGRHKLAMDRYFHDHLDA